MAAPSFNFGFGAPPASSSAAEKGTGFGFGAPASFPAQSAFGGFAAGGGPGGEGGTTANSSSVLGAKTGVGGGFGAGLASSSANIRSADNDGEEGPPKVGTAQGWAWRGPSDLAIALPGGECRSFAGYVGEEIVQLAVDSAAVFGQLNKTDRSRSRLWLSSRDYRSNLETCVNRLEERAVSFEQIENAKAAAAIDGLNGALVLLMRIWHLAEIFMIAPTDRPAGMFAADWVLDLVKVEQVGKIQDLYDEFEDHCSNYGYGGGPPEDYPAYWELCRRLLLRGEAKEAAGVLFRHSQYDPDGQQQQGGGGGDGVTQSAVAMLVELLEEFPEAERRGQQEYSYLEEDSSPEEGQQQQQQHHHHHQQLVIQRRQMDLEEDDDAATGRDGGVAKRHVASRMLDRDVRRWVARCEQAGRYVGDSELGAELSLICRIAAGEERVIQKICVMHEIGWQGLLAAQLIFSVPSASNDEIRRRTTAAREELAPTATSSTGSAAKAKEIEEHTLLVEKVMPACMDGAAGKIVQVVAAMQSQGAEGLSTAASLAHLADLLTSAGVLPEQALLHDEDEQDNTGLVERLYLRYAELLFALPTGGWEVAARYLEDGHACPVLGHGTLATLLGTVGAPASERQCRELFSFMRRRGAALEGEARQLCRARAVYWQSKGKLNSATYWLLRGGGGSRLELLASDLCEALMMATETVLHAAGEGKEEEKRLLQVMAQADGVLAAIPSNEQLLASKELMCLERYRDLVGAMQDRKPPPEIAIRLEAMLRGKVASERVWPHFLRIALPLLRHSSSSSSSPSYSSSSSSWLTPPPPSCQRPGTSFSSAQTRTLLKCLMRLVLTPRKWRAIRQNRARRGDGEGEGEGEEGGGEDGEDSDEDEERVTGGVEVEPGPLGTLSHDEVEQLQLAISQNMAASVIAEGIAGAEQSAAAMAAAKEEAGKGRVGRREEEQHQPRVFLTASELLGPCLTMGL